MSYSLKLSRRKSRRKRREKKKKKTIKQLSVRVITNRLLQ